MNTQSYRKGVIYIILAGVFLSLGGLLVRMIDTADPWTILFYRSLVFSCTITLFIMLRDRSGSLRKFKLIKPADLLVSVFLAIGFISYVLSLYHTLVANTVLILSTGPVFAAVLGWLVLKEQVRPVTWFAMCLAFAGVAVMVSNGVAVQDKIGLMYAFVAVLSFAAMVVSLRFAGANRDMMPATALAGIIAAVFCIPLMPGFAISLHDFMVAALLGSVQIGIGFSLITLGSRSVPAAQIPLLGLAETALSPIWVWLMINEVPSTYTLLGGALVLIAVLFQGVSGMGTQKQFN